jgi:hypothetical protein
MKIAGKNREIRGRVHGRHVAPKDKRKNKRNERGVSEGSAEPTKAPLDFGAQCRGVSTVKALREIRSAHFPNGEKTGRAEGRGGDPGLALLEITRPAAKVDVPAHA